MGTNDLGYVALRDAIYIQAVKDYKRVLKSSNEKESERETIETFLTSGAYNVSPDLGRLMIEMCWKNAS